MMMTTTSPASAALAIPDGIRLSERALLVSLSFSIWGARETDDEVTAKVAADNGTTTEAGAYAKNLMLGEGGKALAAIKKIASAARTEHLALTLPWLDKKGARILASDMLIEYSARMAEHGDKFDTAVRAFVANYGRYCSEQPALLGGLYRAANYPTQAEISGKFAFGFNPIPLPEAGDFRLQLGALEIEKLQRGLAAATEAAAQKANRELIGRALEPIARMAEKLKAYTVTADGVTGAFRDSLVENVAEIAAQLDPMNITGNQAIAEMRERISRDLLRHNPAALRASADKRAETARAAEAIAAQLGEFLA